MRHVRNLLCPCHTHTYVQAYTNTNRSFLACCHGPIYTRSIHMHRIKLMYLHIHTYVPICMKYHASHTSNSPGYCLANKHLIFGKKLPKKNYNPAFCEKSCLQLSLQLDREYNTICLCRKLGRKLYSIFGGYVYRDFRLPLIFAICPTRLPTAPAAPDTTTVSPSFGWQISRNPK